MDRFKLVVKPETFDRTSSSIWGVVYVEIGRKAFPRKDWTDIALGFVLAFWSAVLRLRHRKTSKVSFYDGPYEIHFRRHGSFVYIETLDRHTNDAPPLKCRVKYDELLAESMSALLPWLSVEQYSNRT